MERSFFHQLSIVSRRSWIEFGLLVSGVIFDGDFNGGGVRWGAPGSIPCLMRGPLLSVSACPVDSAFHVLFVRFSRLIHFTWQKKHDTEIKSPRQYALNVSSFKSLFESQMDPHADPPAQSAGRNRLGLLVFGLVSPKLNLAFQYFPSLTEATNCLWWFCVEAQFDPEATGMPRARSRKVGPMDQRTHAVKSHNTKSVEMDSHSLWVYTPAMEDSSAYLTNLNEVVTRFPAACFSFLIKNWSCSWIVPLQNLQTLSTSG